MTFGELYDHLEELRRAEDDAEKARQEWIENSRRSAAFIWESKLARLNTLRDKEIT